MKTIGLLGGMSWESTMPYYRLINEAVKARLGGLHSAKILLASVDFEPIQHLAHSGDWPGVQRALTPYGQQLKAGGADVLVVCTNSMHKVAPAMADEMGLPLLHIADVTTARVRQSGCVRPLLLGTRFTMEGDTYRARINAPGEEVRVPYSSERDEIHRVIFEELCLGVVRPAARETFRRIIARHAAAGADGVILGCTELAMLVQPEDSPVPLFDTTALHAEAAVDWALGGAA